MDTATAATIESLRAALDAARADVVRLTAEADELRRGYAFVASENARLVYDVGVIGNRAAMDSEDAERKLTRERSRADVLAAEVKAWRTPGTMAQSEIVWAAIEYTDRTNALDAAKFEGKP